MASGSESNEINISMLAELFDCIICLEKSKKTHSCPNCDVIYCFNCIKRCIEDEALCPQCNKSIRPEELATCGWSDQTIEQLTLVDTLVEKCSKHSEDLKIYCFTCQSGICYKCILSGETHHQHKSQLLEDVYEQRVAEIKNEADLLHEILNNLSLEMKKRKDQVESLKEQRALEITEEVKIFHSRLDLQFEDKIQSFGNPDASLPTKSNGIEKLKQKIDLCRKISRKSSHILKCPEIMKSLQRTQDIIKSLQEAQDEHSKFDPKLFDFPNEIVPPYNSKRYTLSNFTQVRQHGKAIWSESLTVNGLNWQLMIYPNIDPSFEGGYITVLFLFTGEISDGSAEVEYEIEMLHQSSEWKNFICRSTKRFQRNIACGWPKFYKIDLLSSDGFLDSKTDSLNFIFRIRPPTFFQQCQQQTQYINRLLEHKGKMQEEIARLKGLVDSNDENFDQ